MDPEISAIFALKIWLKYIATLGRVSKSGLLNISSSLQMKGSVRTIIFLEKQCHYWHMFDLGGIQMQFDVADAPGESHWRLLSFCWKESKSSKCEIHAQILHYFICHHIILLKDIIS